MITGNFFFNKKTPNAFMGIGEGQEGLKQKLSNIDLRMEEHFS